jgi:ABC-type polysaccharide/polyol phosphate export permease
MTRFLSAFRALLYDNRLPAWQDWLGVCLAGAAVLTLGIVVFRRFAPRLAEEL